MTPSLLDQSLRAVRSPFKLCHLTKLQHSWITVFCQTVGVFLLLCNCRVLGDDGKEVADQHCCTYVAERRLLMVQVDTKNPASLIIDDDDLVDERATAAKLNDLMGLRLLRHVYELRVHKKRVTETLYGR